jgi:uncharacterized Zn finger protein (UPF0148 family)
MTGQLVLPMFVLWATLFRGLLVAARMLPPSCARCGMLLERRELGESICQCHR